MPLRCLLLLCAAVAGLLATPAHAHAAEAVVLVSGETLQVTHVEVDAKAEQMRFRIAMPSGVALVTEPYDRIAPRTLIGLLREHHVADLTEPTARASAVLHLAQTALARDLTDEAAEAFVEAATLDPTLAEARDGGLAALRVRTTTRVLTEVEGHVRARHAYRALAAIEAARADVLYEAWTPVERMRLGVLERMARRLAPGGGVPVVPPAQEAVPVEPVPVQPAAPAPPAPEPPVLSPVERKVFLATAAELRKAREARLEAADPTRSAARVQRALDQAARAYLAARRRLLALPQPMPEPLLAQATEAQTGLLEVTLAAAEALRLRGRRSEALRYLGAARALDPESPAVLELAARLDADARDALAEPRTYPYRYDGHWLGGFSYGTLYTHPTWLYRSRSGYGYGLFPSRGLGIRGFGPYRGTQRLRGGGGGSRRVVGTRR